MTTRSSYSRSIEKRDGPTGIYTRRCVLYIPAALLYQMHSGLIIIEEKRPRHSQGSIWYSPWMCCCCCCCSHRLESFLSRLSPLSSWRMDGHPLALYLRHSILPKISNGERLQHVDNVCMKRWALLGDDWGWYAQREATRVEFIGPFA